MPNVLEKYFEQLENKPTRKQILELQQNRFQKLIEFVLKHSKYYQEKYINAGITLSNFREKRLDEFPIITKQEVMKNFNQLVTVGDLKQSDLEKFDKNNLLNTLYQGKYHVIHSSGSTGHPYYFIYSQKDWNEMLIGMLRAAFWGNEQTAIN